MHIGAPTILLWYIRSYKNSAAFLAVLLAFLVPSIIILEEHYILDILGGWSVALLAIAFVDWRSLRNNHNTLIIYTKLNSTVQEHDAIG